MNPKSSEHTVSVILGIRFIEGYKGYILVKGQQLVNRPRKNGHMNKHQS